MYKQRAVVVRLVVVGKYLFARACWLRRESHRTRIYKLNTLCIVRVSLWSVLWTLEKKNVDFKSAQNLKFLLENTEKEKIFE